MSPPSITGLLFFGPIPANPLSGASVDRLSAELSASSTGDRKLLNTGSMSWSDSARTTGYRRPDARRHLPPEPRSNTSRRAKRGCPRRIRCHRASADRRCTVSDRRRRRWHTPQVYEAVSGNQTVQPRLRVVLLRPRLETDPVSCPIGDLVPSHRGFTTLEADRAFDHLVVGVRPP
jgi:hypothetical protein